MGTAHGKQDSHESSSECNHDEDIDPNNGFLFGKCFLPPEIVTLILSHVEIKTLGRSGRRVCKAWRDLIDSIVLREKVVRDVPGVDSSIFQYEELEWMDLYQLCLKKPFMKNIVKNGSADSRLEYWTDNSRDRRGRQWIVERVPIGCDPFPDGNKQCFTTSYDWCEKEQVINLPEHGLTTNFLETVCPDIHIEEWHTGRFDCGFHYILKVSLLNAHWEVIDSFAYETSGHTTEWTKVEHTFSGYKGIPVYILFHHKGKDDQFWAGHYGCKITGSKIYITLPKHKRQ